MNGKLYYNKSDKRYVNKELEEVTYIKDGQTMNTISVEFIEDSDVINPTLKMTAFTGGLTANYIYLEDLHRYYYIKDWTLSKGYIYIKCHVDVLMSFKDEIMNETVILERQTTEFDLYQDDPEYKLTQMVNVRTVPFSGGFSNQGANFILLVGGDTDDEEVSVEGGEE